LTYGALSDVIFLFTFLYAIGFIGNMVVPKSLDSPATDPWLTALMIDLRLLSLFAVQHSVMARVQAAPDHGHPGRSGAKHVRARQQLGAPSLVLAVAPAPRRRLGNSRTERLRVVFAHATHGQAA
jgi:protein-S-isoprenylcysteine O-methyltransferase Ste14